jgi:hypothetical protein
MRIDRAKPQHADSAGAAREPPYKIRPDRVSQGFDRCDTSVRRVRIRM